MVSPWLEPVGTEVVVRGSGNKPFQRAMNRALVLQALRARPGISRRDLAAELGLDRSTISNITGELIDASLVAESSPEAGSDEPEAVKDGGSERWGGQAEGRSRSGRGRPPVGLRVLDERLCALGIEITAAGYGALVCDNAGRVRYREASNEPIADADFRESLARLVAEVAERAEADGRSRGSELRVIGAGCAIPGIVNSRESRLIRSREFSLSDQELPTRSASAERPIPIVCDNDAHCGAWGEMHARTRLAARSAVGDVLAGDGAAAAAGAWARDTNLLFVFGRSSVRHLGVGIGLVVDGAVRYGGTHTAGEFYSGRWSGDEGSQFSLEPAALARASGDRSLRAQVFGELCEGLVPVAGVVDPQAVVFGGLFREHFDEITESARQSAAGQRIADLFSSSLLATDEIAGGAAALFHEQLFRVPRYERSSGAALVQWEDVIERLKETV